MVWYLLFLAPAGVSKQTDGAQHVLHIRAVLWRSLFWGVCLLGSSVVSCRVPACLRSMLVAWQFLVGDRVFLSPF